MEFFSGLNFWLVFILISIPAIFLGLRGKKSKYYILGVSLVFCFFCLFKKYKFTHIINNICDI